MRQLARAKLKSSRKAQKLAQMRQLARAKLKSSRKAQKLAQMRQLARIAQGSKGRRPSNRIEPPKKTTSPSTTGAAGETDIIAKRLELYLRTPDFTATSSNFSCS
jgi:hypothetical protein